MVCRRILRQPQGCLLVPTWSSALYDEGMQNSPAWVLFPVLLRGDEMSRPLTPQARHTGEPQAIGHDPFEADFDMQLAEPLSRSVRLNGFATCLRLESIYWAVLKRIAQANQCTVNAVLSHVDREVHLRHGGVRNFSGLVRVICVVFLLESVAQDPSQIKEDTGPFFD